MNNFRLIFPTAFFSPNSFLSQSLAMWAVMKFYHMLRSGISWKMNETIIELWHSSYELKTSTTHSYCEDDTHDESDNLNVDANKNESYLIDYDSQCRKRISKAVDDNDDDCDSLSDNEDVSDGERRIGEGSDEDDTFLTPYAVASVWQ